MSDIETRVKKVAADYFKVKTEGLTDDTNVYTNLEADSLDFVEYLMKLENEFNILIPDYLSCDIETIGDAIKVVKHQLENKSQQFFPNAPKHR